MKIINSDIYKVVIQLSNDNIEKQKALIRQLNNLLNELPQITIEIVVHSDGINFLKNDHPLKNIISEFQKPNISFLACSNTIKSLQLHPAQLFEFITIIPSGVAHLIIRQQEGWSYLKAD